MLTRRLFTVLGTASLCALALRPSWAVPASEDRGAWSVSPRLQRLADAWEATGQDYERCRHEAFFKNAPPMTMWGYIKGAPQFDRWEKSYRTMLAAVDDVINEPSRTSADVILKYHVMDDLAGARCVLNDDAIIEAGGAYWHRILSREAERFTLDLHPFWLGEGSPYAMIDGDRNSRKWAAVSRWCTDRYAAPV
jgi:hypothetical protein